MEKKMEFTKEIYNTAALAIVQGGYSIDEVVGEIVREFGREAEKTRSKIQKRVDELVKAEVHRAPAWPFPSHAGALTPPAVHKACTADGDINVMREFPAEAASAPALLCSDKYPADDVDGKPA